MMRFFVAGSYADFRSRASSSRIFSSSAEITASSGRLSTRARLKRFSVLKLATRIVCGMTYPLDGCVGGQYIQGPRSPGSQIGEIGGQKSARAELLRTRPALLEGVGV